MIHAQLVRKSWTACGYPNKKDEITGANEGAVVAYTGEQVESLVDRLYCGNGPDGDEHGAEVHLDFIDEACVGEDPHFPCEDECSSDEKVNELPNAPEASPTAATQLKSRMSLLGPNPWSWSLLNSCTHSHNPDRNLSESCSRCKNTHENLIHHLCQVEWECGEKEDDMVKLCPLCHKHAEKELSQLDE